MNELEMMNNEEVQVLMEESVKLAPGKGLKTAGIVGGAILVGVGVYKGGKWAIKKIKTLKEERAKAKAKAEVENEENTDY